LIGINGGLADFSSIEVVQAMRVTTLSLPTNEIVISLNIDKPKSLWAVSGKGFVNVGSIVTSNKRRAFVGC
jgi:ribosomal protein S4E